MVRKSQEWPDEGELIVGTVYKVLNYGAFAKLELEITLEKIKR